MIRYGHALDNVGAQFMIHAILIIAPARLAGHVDAAVTDLMVEVRFK